MIKLLKKCLEVQYISRNTNRLMDDNFQGLNVVSYFLGKYLSFYILIGANSENKMSRVFPQMTL